MSPLRSFRRGRGEDGFSLVEILVSIAIFGVVSAAVLPLLLAGIRGGTVAKLSTQAKGLAQERMELMRNLPFHIAQQNGDYLDVLDIYFRDLVTTAPATPVVGDPCASRGYVTASKSYECSTPATMVGPTTFTQQVVTRFVAADGAVVTPRAGYKSWQSGVDSPASNLLDVVITTRWKLGSADKEFVLRSRITNSTTTAPLVTSQIRGSAVKVTGATAAGEVLQFEAGLVSADGSKATASSANATAVGAYASRGVVGNARGAEMTLAAPPNDVRGGDSADQRELGSCAVVCFGNSKVKGVTSAVVSTGVPQVGVDGATKGLQAELSNSGDSVARGFSFSNTDLGTAGASLGIGQLPLFSAIDGGSGSLAASEGYLDAKATGATSVTAQVKATTQSLRLFRTTMAPQGLLQITLARASLTCVDGAGAGVTADWLAEVRVHTGENSTGYRAYSVAPGAAPLPAPGTITLSDGSLLSRYVQDWGGLVGAASSVTQPGLAGASAKIPAVVTVLTTKTRTDENSVLNIAVGSVSCTAEDNQ